MRKDRHPLDALIPRTRQLVLAATLMHPARWWYLSDLAKHVSVTPSSLQREVAALVDSGVLRRKREGNRVYYQADTGNPFFPELQGLLIKTVGLVDVLRDALKRFAPGVVAAFVYGSFARGQERTGSDVDLMVVGSIGLEDLAPALRRAEARLGREVTVTLYPPQELATKAHARNHFVREVLSKEKLFVLGSEDELETVVGGRQHPAAEGLEDRT